MAKQIVNEAPMVIARGTEDLSTRLVPREQEPTPQHLPKFYLFTEKGPMEPQLVTGAERVHVFGTKTFDNRSVYHNHSTAFANLVNAEANACMIQRVIADDAGPESNLTLWLDVLPTDVDLYARDALGQIQLDNLGAPTITGTTPGFKFKWVLSNETVGPLNPVGQLLSVPGDQTDTVTGVQSQRYPIIEVRAASKGAYGNLAGIRMWAPTSAGNDDLPTKMMAEEKAYPYTMAIIRKTDVNASPDFVKTLFGEISGTYTLKPNVIDPLTNLDLYAGDTFVDNYQNITDPRYAKVAGDFGDLYVYDANLDLILTDFFNAELPFVDGFSDITTNIDSMHLLNVVSGVSSFNVPYHSLQMVTDATSVILSSFTNLFADGGSDGSLDDVTHANLVTEEVTRYIDPNDNVQDSAINVESIMYDTGFPIDTKYALINFVGLRKDTFVVLGTHDANDRVLTASEENSIAISLRTRLQSFPESEYFGTPVMRGMIMGRSGLLRNKQYSKPLPLTAEVAVKSARYMGASNGKWKNGFHFEGAPGSIIENMYDINIGWIPTSVRNRDWDVGLNWVQTYDRRSHFFPALKTVYSNGTSVLNSYLTAMAIVQLNKIAFAAWREFSGVSHLTNAQLVGRVNDFVANRVKGIFDDRYIIEPDTYFTDLDLLRGFSWVLPIRIYAPNTKTVMTSYVQAFRKDGLV